MHNYTHLDRLFNLFSVCLHCTKLERQNKNCNNVVSKPLTISSAHSEIGPVWAWHYLREPHKAQGHAHTFVLVHRLGQRQRSEGDVNRAASSSRDHLEVDDRRYTLRMWGGGPIWGWLWCTYSLLRCDTVGVVGEDAHRRCDVHGGWSAAFLTHILGYASFFLRRLNGIQKNDEVTRQRCNVGFFLSPWDEEHLQWCFAERHSIPCSRGIPCLPSSPKMSPEWR